jgi:arylsulfatase A-like enzyme
VPDIYTVGSSKGTDHASPYTYDTHVPLAFYGLPFHPGTYRTRAEPVDLAVTLASLLGINAPTHAVGRVLTEALASAHNSENASGFVGEGRTTESAREDHNTESVREGHDFSRAAPPPSSTAASAAEVRSQSENNQRPQQ